MKYLENISANLQSLLAADLSKCYCCGSRQIVNCSLTDKVMKIIDTGLVVPDTTEGILFGCFDCIHITDTLIKYKELLQTSQISLTSVKPYQNLTETLNIAKTKRGRSRKNAFPVKSISLPKMQNCSVILTRLDDGLPNGLVNGTSTPKRSKAVSKKPVQLQQGQSWDNSGLTSNFSKQKDSVRDIERGYRPENGELPLTPKRRIIHKRKHDDFVYFAKKGNTDEPSTKSSVPKEKKLSRNPPKSLKGTAKENLETLCKPCVVQLHRIVIPQSENTIDEPSPEQNQSENQNGRESPAVIHPPALSYLQNGCVSPIDQELPIELGFKQNENSTPNIPDVAVVSCKTPSDVSTSSTSTISVCLLTYKEPTAPESPLLPPILLSPNRSRDNNDSRLSKSVSFSNYAELIFYDPEPEEISDNSNQMSHEEQLNHDNETPLDKLHWE